jgi:hypothetical protein
MDRALRIFLFLSAELYLILGYVEGGELFDYSISAETGGLQLPRL